LCATVSVVKKIPRYSVVPDGTFAIRLPQLIG